MNKLGTIKLKGQSGNEYEFNIYPIDEECPDESGVYVFTKRVLDNDKAYTHAVYYVGKAQSFVNRFYSHDGMDCAKKKGANCVCLKWIKSEKDRQDIEVDIIKHYNPSCNTHHTK